MHEYNSTDEDESEDEYGVRPSHKSRKKRRRVAATTNDTPPAEVRFSTRRAGRVTNYNEDDEDDFEEEDATPGYEYLEPEPDAGPGIDLILDHRPREGIGIFLPRKPLFLSLTRSRYLKTSLQTCRS